MKSKLAHPRGNVPVHGRLEDVERLDLESAQIIVWSGGHAHSYVPTQEALRAALVCQGQTFARTRMELLRRYRYDTHIKVHDFLMWLDYQILEAPGDRASMPKSKSANGLPNPSQ